MDHAEAGKAHGDPVEPGRGNRQLRHGVADIREGQRRYNITFFQFHHLPLGSPHANRRSPVESVLAPSNETFATVRPRPGGLSNLLLVVAALVFAMVVIGGITRLTESGLSITEWRPISGVVPPLTSADWQRAFDLYKHTPQYVQVAGPAGMTLAGFKLIFFWEWVHRLLGRLLGLVFFAGVGWFALRRAIPKGYGWRLGALFVL